MSRDSYSEKESERQRFTSKTLRKLDVLCGGEVTSHVTKHRLI